MNNSFNMRKKGIKQMLLIMRLITLFCFVLTMQLSARAYSQNNRFNLNLHDKSIKDVFNHISENSNYRFFYNNKFNAKKKVSIVVKSSTVQDILDKLLNGTNYSYKIKDNYIVIKEEIKARKRYTISGVITDKESGEKLIGANIFETSSLKGAASNVYGFYSLTLPNEKIKLAYSFVGYKTVVKEFTLNKDTTINIDLLSVNTLKEVVVTASSSLKEVQSPQMSNTKICIDKIKNLPSFLGEADVIKTIQLLPGVQSGTEGSSGLYVRGGGPDQNLILLDGVPVYNANHIFGFFSVFNPDAVKNVELYKGGFPARFGGRLSSVVDIRMKEGNEKELKGTFSIGLISSKLNLEGPIIKDRTSFNISLRRTYLDMVARPFMKKEDRGNMYYFYDVNAKINHKFSEKSRLYLSLYTGLDKAGNNSDDKWTNNEDTYLEEDNSKLSWGNITGALRWNYIFSNKLFSNTTITYSRYNFNINSDTKETNLTKNTWERNIFDYNSGINDLSYKIDFDYFPCSDYLVRFGANYINHTFKPGVNTSQIDESGESTINKKYGDKDIQATEFSAYIENELKLGNRLNLNIGFHYSCFDVNKSFYQSFEPRANLSFLISERFSFKAAYSKMQQYIHLLSNSSISLPTDLWVPVTDKIKPMTSEQYATGFAYNIKDGINVSVEGFYKTMDNLIEYKEGASFFGSATGWEEKVEMGKGWSYGMEFLLNKTIGKTSGWLGYTLSWTDRKFENISFGEKFPAKYDRRHDVSLAMTHKFSKKFDIGMNWVYGTGNALTLATQRIVPNLNKTSGYAGLVDFYEGRNNYRAPAYHRMDIGFNFHKKKKHGIRTWNISIYNVYNRKNAFYLYFGHDKTNENENKQVLKQVSIFSIIPSVSYIYKF